jgi:preprotein translocase subunit YajC
MTFIYWSMAAHPGIIFAAKQSGTQKASSFTTYGMWILILVMVLVFYMLLIRPQRKRSQEHEEMVTKLERGDEVVTIGGVHGVIKRITEDEVVLEVDKGVKITFARSAISRRVSQPEEEEETGEEPAGEEEAETAEEEETKTAGEEEEETEE